MLIVSCRDALSSDSPKTERIEGNRRNRGNSPKRGDTGIGQVFFVYVNTGSIGFRRVAVLAIGLVRKEAVDDRRLDFFGYFFYIFSPTVRIPLFKRTVWTVIKAN